MSEKNNKLNVEFGNGLQGSLPTKSPLSRNQVFTLIGDSCSDVHSDAES